MIKAWYTPAAAGVVPEVPWLSPEVTKYLETIIQPEWTILEHGSGGSTLWFAQRVKRVVAVESDGTWYRMISAKTRQNVKMILQPGGAVPKIYGRFNMILIDGEPLEDRGLWLDACEKYLHPGGIIALDNYNRPEYASAQKRLADKYHYKTFTAPVGLYLNTRFYFTGGRDA